MIVRIATEGQYRLDDAELEELDRIDDTIVQALEASDGVGFKRRYAGLLERVRAGDRLEEDQLAPSDLILPPPDLSLEEAAHGFTGEGLIPQELP
jgi:hypothetical protein